MWDLTFRFIHLEGGVCAHKASLTPLLIVEMPDQTQENEL